MAAMGVRTRTQNPVRLGRRAPPSSPSSAGGLHRVGQRPLREIFLFPKVDKSKIPLPPRLGGSNPFPKAFRLPTGRIADWTSQGAPTIIQP